MRILRLVAVQAAVAFLLLEIALRIYNPFPFRMRGTHLVLPVHRRYEFTHEHSTKLDPVTHHSKNSLGFRGPDPPRDLDRRPSIVTIGGSTTECLFLSDGRTWTDVLARRVAAVHPDAWVNNAGLDGQSTFGHLVLLRDVIVPLKPKIAIFLVGINDVGVDTQNQYDTSMRSSWIPWRQQWNVYDDRLVGSRTPWHDEWAFLTDHSEIFGLIENFRRMRQARSLAFSGGEWDLPARPRLDLPPAQLDALLARVRPALDGYAGRLREIVQVTRSNGIEPVFVTQPLLAGDLTDVDPVTGVNLGTLLMRSGENGVFEWRRVELYNDVTTHVAADAHVTLVDLAHALPKDSRYFYDFMHYTNDGAARVGDIVADGVLPIVR